MQHGTLLHSTLAIVMTSPVASVCTWNLVLALNGASCTNLQRVIFSKKSLLGNISRCIDEKLCHLCTYLLQLFHVVYA